MSESALLGIFRLARLTHIVAGAVEVLCPLPWTAAAGGYLLPALLGNILRA